MYTALWLVNVQTIIEAGDNRPFLAAPDKSGQLEAVRATG